MANLERESRVDSVRSFDFDDEEPAAEDGARLPLLIVIALVVLAAFGGVVWLAYTQGVERGRTEGPLIASARSSSNSGTGSHTPAFTGLNIYQSTTQHSAMAVSRNHAGPFHPASAPPQLRPSSSGGQETFAAGTQPEHPFATPQPTASPASPTAAKAASAPAANASKVKVAATSEAIPTPTPSPTHVPPPASTPPAAAPPAAAPAAGSGGALLQIGSYKSEAEARQSWLAFKSRHPLASSYGTDIKEVDLGNKGVWYRLRVGPFDDKDSAAAACAKLRADGASCLIAR